MAGVVASETEIQSIDGVRVEMQVLGKELSKKFSTFALDLVPRSFFSPHPSIAA
jgi:hypothetical protein